MSIIVSLLAKNVGSIIFSHPKTVKNRIFCTIADQSFLRKINDWLSQPQLLSIIIKIDIFGFQLLVLTTFRTLILAECE